MRKKGPRKLRTGSAGARLKRQDGTVTEKNESIYGPLEPFQKLMGVTGLSLSEVLNACPRAGVAMRGTLTEDYQSVSVEVWLEETVPGWDGAAKKRHYREILKQVDFVLGRLLDDAKKEVLKR